VTQDGLYQRRQSVDLFSEIHWFQADEDLGQIVRRPHHGSAPAMLSTSANGGKSDANSSTVAPFGR
jgi:hypothetical protein